MRSPTCRTIRHNEVMESAELRAQREYLGLSTLELARQLNVNDRTINRWEYGHQPVPDGVAGEIAAWLDEADEAVETLAAAARDGGVIVTYRNDAQVREHLPGSRWPATWHRIVAARAAADVDARIVYADEVS